MFILCAVSVGFRWQDVQLVTIVHSTSAIPSHMVMYNCKPSKANVTQELSSRQTAGGHHGRGPCNTYSYMWGPCIITSTLTVPLAISLHFTHDSLLVVHELCQWSHILQRSGKGQERLSSHLYFLQYQFLPLENRADFENICTFKLEFCYHGSPFKFKGAITVPQWRALDSFGQLTAVQYSATASVPFKYDIIIW